MRSQLICHKIPQSNITTSILRAFDPAQWERDVGGNTNDEWDVVWDTHYRPFGDRILVNVTDELCGQFTFPDLTASAVCYVGKTAPSQGVFGATHADHSTWMNTCSDFAFIWGQFQSSDNKTWSVTASAVIRNVSIETVDVDVVLSGQNFSFDPTRKPVARENTSQVAIFSRELAELEDCGSNTWYYGLEARRANTWEVQDRVAIFDDFFSLLTTSRYAIPMDLLANLDEEDAVISTIKFQHNVISAQAFNV
ncbi:hypothetical protein LQW54_001750 [Pestalotiopsis sp. IQ-011]